MNTAQKIKQISDLIVGEGAHDFRELERLTNRFCPFEAIGMVHQEIKHSTYLSYLFDENRPHDFGSKILEEFLRLVSERVLDLPFGFSPLDLYFMDFTNSTILREWRNIDLVIEIPKSSTGHTKNLVIAIELKIHASESAHQLKKYEKTIRSEYKSDSWEHVLIFLTLNEDEPSSNDWLPVGLTELVSRLEKLHESFDVSSKSTDLLGSYLSMVRRNLMTDEKLKTLARKIWAKHKEALDALYDFEPDLRSESMELFFEQRNAIASQLSDKFNLSIIADTSHYGIIRFTISDWDKYPEMVTGDGSWLDSDRLVAIEVALWGEKVRASFVIGPGESENREKLFDKVLKRIDKGKIKIGKKTPVSSTPHKHLSAQYLITEAQLLKASQDEIDADDIKDKLVYKLISFLDETLDEYEKIVSKAFS